MRWNQLTTCFLTVYLPNVYGIQFLIVVAFKLVRILIQLLNGDCVIRISSLKYDFFRNSMVLIERKEWHVFSTQTMDWMQVLWRRIASTLEEMGYSLSGYTKAEDGSLYLSITLQDDGAPAADLEMKTAQVEKMLWLRQCVMKLTRMWKLNFTIWRCVEQS